ncbi:benzoquinone reductase [Tulasnella calospora MUT 4182]|uniref:Benzoquinone reductase n=1 Tax=Tulasnella calospora MUT 4182 TaxID=1051891 RepID=A0A0C3QV63_9AGAM|nr:benzoquinone reductase [Tulasnella calospora MUT 4182]
MTKIAVIYYSLYNHCKTLAETALASTKADGVDAEIYQVPETLSDEILAKMHAPPKADYPIITPDKLTEFDGYIFVIPTRYGRAVSQFSSFFDATGGLWATQALSKKFATIITSTGTQHGGQETTALTTLPFFAHHGIIFVPLGYATPDMLNMDQILAGGPWGAGTLAGADGSRQPSELELRIVGVHAKHFVDVVSKFVKGA